MKFTTEDYEMLLESLMYSKRAVEDAENHPSYEFKLKKVKKIESLINKVRTLKKQI
jgi:hypothetical protein